MAPPDKINALNVDKLTEAQAKQELGELQKKYGALIVNFNNQQAELLSSQKRAASLEAEVQSLKQQMAGSSSDQVTELQGQLEKSMQELRAMELANMQLQKKVNKLQVEHVSEEEVDQLFYALEQKDEQLAQAQKEKEGLELEVLTARQHTARGGNFEPKFIEIHHNNLSDDDDDEVVD